MFFLCRTGDAYFDLCARMVNTIDSKATACLNSLLENPKGTDTALLDFFTDVNHQALDLELSLIVERPNCPLEVTIGIVLVGLKLIAINVCVIVAVCKSRHQEVLFC
jgi:hypothetical protein